MYLISTDEFINATFISNASEPNSGVNEKLNDYINASVPKLLKQVLGTQLFSELNSEITDGVLNDDASQKWKDLVNGKTYIKNAKEYVWEGLLINRGLYIESLLTYFVWWEFMNDNIFAKGQQGDLLLNTKNATVVSPLPNLARNWNRFLEMYQGGVDCETYPRSAYVNGAYFVDYYGQERGSNLVVDLVTFLRDNEVAYPTANLYQFTDTAKSNRFSI